MNNQFIIKANFNSDIDLLHWSKISRVLLNIFIEFDPKIFTKTIDNTNIFVFTFTSYNGTEKQTIYRMLNSLVGIPTFEYETIVK